MPTSLFDSPDLDAPEAQPPRRDPPRRDEPAPPDRSPRRLALMLVASALLGGGVAAGGVLALDNDSTTTIVRTPAATTTVARTSSGGLDAAALYARTSAGVVDITARGVSDAVDAGPFGAPQQEQTATGTGFVVDKSGHIVTAAHVVDGASSIKVTFRDGTTRTARLLGKDDATDVAVLSVDASGLTLQPLTLGSSAKLGVGDELAVIGDPFGYQRSISTGIVSGLDRTIQAPNGFTVAHAIQTDAAMNPGNSGGPVLDADGNVIGIADQIATGSSSSETSSGVGFAVPVDLIKSELSQLVSGGSVSHAWLGVSTSSQDSTGALVAQVSAGGPAADAGLRAGDVVTAIGSTRVTGSNDLVAAIATHKPGEHVTLTVRRGSETERIEVTLGTQPTSASSR